MTERQTNNCAPRKGVRGRCAAALESLENREPVAPGVWISRVRSFRFGVIEDQEPVAPGVKISRVWGSGFRVWGDGKA